MRVSIPCSWTNERVTQLDGPAHCWSLCGQQSQCVSLTGWKEPSERDCVCLSVCVSVFHPNLLQTA